MKEGKEYLTQEKFQQLKQELETLQTSKRKEVAEQLEYARSLGDLSENAEYQEAREAQSRVESRITQLEGIIKNAEIITSHSTDIVDAGSVVTLEKTKSKEKVVYELVGSEESDLSQNKISYLSPLGSAIVGKKKGEVFTFETPKGKVEYKVVKIA